MSQQASVLKITLVSILALIIVGYAAFNSRFLIEGPEIVLAFDKDEIVSQDKTLFLEGQVLHSSFISINGRPIFVDEQGNFNEKLLLSNGVSIIDIYAKDKFGKEVRKKIDVLYQGDNSPSVALQTLVSTSTASTTLSATSTEEFTASSTVMTKVSFATSSTH